MSLFGRDSSQNSVHPSNALPGSDKAAKENELAGTFAAGVNIEPIRNSRLVRINYDSPDPAFSQRAANAIAESFISSNLEHKAGSTTYAKGYLEDRLKELKIKLEDSERKLVEFAQKEQIIGTSGGDDSTRLGSSGPTVARYTVSLSWSSSKTPSKANVWFSNASEQSTLSFGSWHSSSLRSDVSSVLFLEEIAVKRHVSTS